jgi:hypothetical protein
MVEKNFEMALSQFRICENYNYCGKVEVAYELQCLNFIIAKKLLEDMAGYILPISSK